MKKISKRLKAFNAAFPNFGKDSSSVEGFLKEKSSYLSSHAVKFNESIDVIVNTFADPKKSDQVIKSFVDLPHSVRIVKPKLLVFCEGDDINIAKSCGADYAGGESLFDSILNGSISDFDQCVSLDYIFPKLKKIARVLGPKGLMPNQKLGTVCTSNELSTFIKNVLFSRTDIKTNKDGAISLSFAKSDFTDQQILDNIKCIFSSVKSLKPTGLKGDYIKSCFFSFTMGPSYKISTSCIFQMN